jgi:hypothetical protein
VLAGHGENQDLDTGSRKTFKSLVNLLLQVNRKSFSDMADVEEETTSESVDQNEELLARHRKEKKELQGLFHQH